MLFFVLLRPCSRFRLAPFLILLRHLHFVSFQNTFVFIVFLFLFFGLACFVVLSYPVRWQFTCFALIRLRFFLFVSVSQSVTMEFISLQDEESGRALSVLADAVE
ncbi:unnamed protein product [Laminaria digitata]